MPLPVTDRTTIAGGPAAIIFNGGKFYSAEPIELPANVELFDIPSDAFQVLDRRVNDERFSMSFKLVGEWESLSVLYPYLGTVPGTLIFGADVPLDVLSLTDDVVTRFHAAAITKQPNLRLAPTETLLENVDFTFLRKNLTGRTEDNSLFTQYNLRLATFTLTYSSAIAAQLFNVTAAALQTALNANATITSDGGVVVTGTYKSGFTVTWNTVGVRATALTGTVSGFPTGTTVDVAVTQAGTVSLVEIRTVKLQPWVDTYGAISVSSIVTQPYEARWLSNGTFTITYGANTTSSLAFNASSSQVQTALNALASITSAGGVTVSGDLNDDWVVTFNTVGARTAFTGAVLTMPGGTSLTERVTTTGSATVAHVVRLKLSPWASFGSQGGIGVTFAEQFEDRITDADGLSNIRFMGLTVRAEWIPDGVTDAQILAAQKVQGAGAERGRSLNSGSQNLDIVNTGVFVRLYGANLAATNLRYAANADRVGTIAFEATRVISGGAVSNMAFVGTAAP